MGARFVSPLYFSAAADFYTPEINFEHLRSGAPRRKKERGVYEIRAICLTAASLQLTKNSLA
jgi:hypothetical protein